MRVPSQELAEEDRELIEVRLRDRRRQYRSTPVPGELPGAEQAELDCAGWPGRGGRGGQGVREADLVRGDARRVHGDPGEPKAIELTGYIARVPEGTPFRSCLGNPLDAGDQISPRGRANGKYRAGRVSCISQQDRIALNRCLYAGSPVTPAALTPLQPLAVA
jgi:hypothetical protein